MISFSVWHSLPLASRVKICDTFGVSKTGPTHVVDNRIESDGYRFQDIEKALTTEALQEYTNSKEKDFNALWNLMAEKMEGREPAELQPRNIVQELDKDSDEEVLKGDLVEVKDKKVTKVAKKKAKKTK